ncbi:MAG: antitoxin family protein [Chloroflexi bacterium]|nr:antitoxin family protein [Chloroflexota bacterium]
MIKSIEAVFDGNVLRPDQPLGLEPNTRVRITVETTEPIVGKTESFLQIAKSLNIQGPSDWAERIEDYLYGNRGDGKASIP